MKRMNWTPEAKEYLRLCSSTPAQELAAHFGCTANAARLARRDFDLTAQRANSWSAVRIAELRQLAATLTDREIAPMLGCSAVTVGKWRRRKGIASRFCGRPRWWTVERIKELQRLSTAHPVATIARMMGCSVGSIAAARRALHPAAAGPSARRWTPARVEELRQLAQSTTLSALAERYGVSRSGIYQVRRRFGITEKSPRSMSTPAGCGRPRGPAAPPCPTPALRRCVQSWDLLAAAERAGRLRLQLESMRAAR
ncbi:MAG: hypothetical protein WCA44_17985 [Acidobacteriaceae bacterium]